MSRADLEGQLEEKKQKLRDYKKRKSELMSIQGNYSSFNSDAGDLNKHCTNTSDYIKDAIIISGGSNDPSGLWGTKDSGSGDVWLSYSQQCVIREINRVADIIPDLEHEIDRLRAQINAEITGWA